VTQTQTCEAKKEKEKKKKPQKKKPREVCHRGTYYETKTGLVKHVKEKIQCR